MPTLLKSDVIAGWAHCVDPFCEGNQQEPVKALRDEIGYSFVELGGDIGGIERSNVHLRFADEKDMACPECGRVRELADQTRRDYMPLSGHPQDGLLRTKYAEKFQEIMETPEEKVVRLRAELAAAEEGAQ